MHSAATMFAAERKRTSKASPAPTSPSATFVSSRSQSDSGRPLPCSQRTKAAPVCGAAAVPASRCRPFAAGIPHTGGCRRVGVGEGDTARWALEYLCYRRYPQLPLYCAPRFSGIERQAAIAHGRLVPDIPAHSAHHSMLCMLGGSRAHAVDRITASTCRHSNTSSNRWT